MSIFYRYKNCSSPKNISPPFRKARKPGLVLPFARLVVDPVLREKVSSIVRDEEDRIQDILRLHKSSTANPGVTLSASRA